MQQNTSIPVEHHPWEPYVPEGAHVLLLGTFPPGSHRWSMDFYYPNATNDFWRIMGIIFEDDATALYDKTTRTFKLNRIKSLLDTYGIALSDTVLDARRTHGTASDKDLEVLRMRDIPALAAQIHDLRAIATTGQKAAEIVAAQTCTSVPSMGMHAAFDSLEIWRLPSTSRAYPMALEAKAVYYRCFFAATGILKP